MNQHNVTYMVLQFYDRFRCEILVDGLITEKQFFRTRPSASEWGQQRVRELTAEGMRA